MKIQEIFVSVSKDIIKSAICWLVIAVICVGSVICQETMTIRKNIGSTVALGTYKEIPAATEQCSPAECEWWERLRQVGNELQRKGSEKLKRKFVAVFVEGLEKSYRIPLKDHPSQMIVPVMPAPLSPGVRPKNGKVVLSVEVRSDGSVGEIKVVEGLRKDMDELCIQAQRQRIFLPAVKDGAFVADWRKAECGFWAANGIN
jgi:hypothetical protein